MAEGEKKEWREEERVSPTLAVAGEGVRMGSKAASSRGRSPETRKGRGRGSPVNAHRCRKWSAKPLSDPCWPPLGLRSSVWVGKETIGGWDVETVDTESLATID